MADDEQPSLLDVTLAFLYERRHDRALVLYDMFKRAKKYVLDDKMSAFLADLALHGMDDIQQRPDLGLIGTFSKEYLDSLRCQARLPFPAMWIEHNNIEYLKRVNEIKKNNDLIVDDNVIPRVGILLYTSKYDDNVFCATIFGQRESSVIPLPFSIYWSVAYPLPLFENDKKIVWTRQFNSDVVGCTGYRTDHVSVACAVEYGMDAHATLMREFAGTLRKLWALLATLTDVPTVHREVVMARGQMPPSRRNYKQYLDHSVMTISIPRDEYKKVIQRAFKTVHSRHQGHEVSGHWRLYQRGKEVLCRRNLHLWAYEGPPPDQNAKETLRCKRCPAWKTWIRYQDCRGDGTLGFLTHDYIITKNENGEWITTPRKDRKRRKKRDEQVRPGERSD